MSKATYHASGSGRPLVWLRGRVQTPPFSSQARRAAGALLRLLQTGHPLAMPTSRPMPVLGPRCHELRLNDGGISWRLIYRTDPDAILIVDVFRKTTRATPGRILRECRRRLRIYDESTGGRDGS